MNKIVIFSLVLLGFNVIHGMEKFKPGTFNDGQIRVRIKRQQEEAPATAKNELRNIKKEWLKQYIKEQTTTKIILP